MILSTIKERYLKFASQPSSPMSSDSASDCSEHSAESVLDLDDLLAQSLTSTSKKRSRNTEPEHEAPTVLSAGPPYVFALLPSYILVMPSNVVLDIINF